MSADYANALIDWTGDISTLLDLMKFRLGVCDNDTSQDEILTLYLTMAGEAAEKYLDNKLIKQEVTERIAIPYSPIDLRYWPAEAPTLIELDAEDVTTDYESFVQDGIRWTAKNGSAMLNRDDDFKQLDVTYMAGFDPVPADIAYALTSTAVSYSNNAGNVSGAVSKEVVNGVGSITYDTTGDSEGSVGMLTPSTMGGLEKYRRYHD